MTIFQCLLCASTAFRSCIAECRELSKMESVICADPSKERAQAQATTQLKCILAIQFFQGQSSMEHDSTLLLAESLQPSMLNSTSECLTANFKLFCRYLLFKLILSCHIFFLPILRQYIFIGF